jgi:hypothetical protein
MSTTTIFGIFNSAARGVKILSSYWNTFANAFESFGLAVGQLTQAGGFLNATDFNGTAVPASLTVSVSGGYAFLGASGRIKGISVTATQTPVVTAGSTNYVWITQSGVAVVDTNPANQPADSMLAFTCVTSGTQVTSVANFPTGRINLTHMLGLLISSNDRVGGYLNGKMLGTANEITLTENNDGASETLTLSLATKPSYGEIYEDTPAGTGITITTAGTYVGWITATAGTVVGGTLMTSDITQASGDRLVCGTTGPGKYKITAVVSLKGANNAVVKMAIHRNGTIVGNGKATVTMAATALTKCVEVSCIVNMSNTDYIDLRFDSGTNGDVVTVYDVNLTAVRLGP